MTTKSNAAIVAGFGGVVAAIGGAMALLTGPSCNYTEACFSWDAPVRYTDGSTIPANKTILYTVYKSRSAATLGSVIDRRTTSRNVKLTGLTPGMWYFGVTATVDDIQSSLSNTSSKLIRKPAPTDGAIETP